MKNSEKVPESRISYLIGIIINFFVLYAVNKAPEWNIVFLTEEYVDVRQILAAAILVQLAGSVILIILRTAVMHYLLHVIFNFVTVYALYRLIVVFPFDFASLGAPAVGTILKILLSISLIATIIGLISNMYKLKYTLKKDRRG